MIHDRIELTRHGNFEKIEPLVKPAPSLVVMEPAEHAVRKLRCFEFCHCVGVCLLESSVCLDLLVQLCFCFFQCLLETEKGRPGDCVVGFGLVQEDGVGSDARGHLCNESIDINIKYRFEVEAYQ